MKVTFASLALLLVLPLTTSAQDVVSRKGFHLGLDLGVGSAEIDNETTSRGAVGLRLGYGFSERFAVQLYSNAIAFENATAGQGFLAARVNVTRSGSKNAVYLRLGGGASQLTGSGPSEGVKLEGTAGVFGFGLDRSLGSVFLDVSLNLVSADYEEVTIDGVSFGGVSAEGEYVVATVGVTYILGRD